jgi:flagellar basal body-associated protein FliL
LAEEEGKNGLMKLIIIAVSIIIVLSIIGFVMVKFVNPEQMNLGSVTGKEKEAQEQSDEIGPTHQLGDFTVNFAEESNYQFLKASITFEVSHDKLKEELNKRNPQIRDMVISILRSQTPEDIKAPSTDAIKKEIKTKINETLNTGEVKNVWFTQLVIQ